MRRRFGIPLTAALLLVVMMTKSFSPIEPYYLLIGVTTLLAVIDSMRLKVSEHGSSPLLSPVALAAWMLIAWPLAFPWYLKVRYLVANGESADKVGSMAAIRLAFLGIFVVGGALFAGGGAMVLTYFPSVRDYLAKSIVVARDLGRQFGGSASLALSTDRELVITMDQDRPNDAAANERFARQVARYARSHFPGGDSLKSIEVVLHDAKAGNASRGRFKWTIAELTGASQPSSVGSPAAAQIATTTASRGAPPNRANLATVTLAGTPAGGAPRTTVPRASVPTHAFARLGAADPTVRWISDSALVADFDCDGAVDTIAIARKRAEVHVGLARAMDPEPQILVFDVGQAKGAVAGVRAALSMESLDWDPTERGLQDLSGLRRSSTCKGVSLGDGDGRNVHIFWSHSSKHLEWYQR
jgi:hypothetical protein